MHWDPSQYMKFADHRIRPAIDLLNRVELTHPSTIYDLGAGAGNITKILASRWPQARVTGIDESKEMLSDKKLATKIDWQVRDIRSWCPENPVDLIFSNAALHWLPDHERLFPKLMSFVTSGGIFAVQMPTNFNAPSHLAISEAVHSGPWRSKIERLLNPSPVKTPDFYIKLLMPMCDLLDVWETEYQQILFGDNPVKEWTKGTWLKPLLDALEEPERSYFEEYYAEIVSRSYPKETDGSTVFPFRRLFLIAKRQ